MKNRGGPNTVKDNPASSSVKHQDFWRGNLFTIYQGLFRRWVSIDPDAVLLKTDLYDEVETNHSPLLASSFGFSRIAGIDISFEIAAKARLKLEKINPALKVLACDVRKLAFKSGSFDLVISTSTLDHFRNKGDIVKSLNEICRVLKNKGSLIITLDNIHNPVVKLRNLLPYSWLRCLRIVPYSIGKTVSLPELRLILECSGFKISEEVFIDHHPRILTVWVGYAIQKTGIRPLESFFQKALEIFERLQTSPIGFLTGYFVAIKAIKET